MHKQALMCVMIALSTAASAQIYEWRDAQGKLNYSDRPPAGVDAKPVRSIKTPPPAQAAAVGTAPKSLAEQNLERQQRLLEEADARKKADEAKRLAEEQRIFCEQTLSNLSLLESGQVLRHLNAQGEPEYLDDATRADQIERSRELLRTQCP